MNVKTITNNISTQALIMELLWVGTAYLAGLITSRQYFPPLAGYLLAGYILHVAGVHANETLAHLADIGIELLLFTVGLKLKLRSLLRSEVLSVGGLHLLLAEHMLDSPRNMGA